MRALTQDRLHATGAQGTRCSGPTARPSSGAAGRRSRRVATAARPPRRRLFGGAGEEDPEVKYADWIDAAASVDDAGSGGSGPGSPRSGVDPTLSMEERTAALAMLQRSGLMSITAIREAYLQRIAQDIQEESASRGAPPAPSSLLRGELAKIGEELGEALESDWAAAESAALTTTGRARRRGGGGGAGAGGGTAEELRPPPRRPAGADFDETLAAPRLRRPAWAGDDDEGDDDSGPMIGDVEVAEEEEAPLEIGDSRVLDLLAQSAGLPGLSPTALEAAAQQRQTREMVIAARRRLAEAEAAMRARPGGAAAAPPPGAPPSAAAAPPSPPVWQQRKVAPAARPQPAAPPRPKLSLEQLIAQKKAEKESERRRAPAPADRLAAAHAKLRAVQAAAAGSTERLSAALSGRAPPLRPGQRAPGGPGQAEEEEEEAVWIDEDEKAPAPEEFGGAEYWAELAESLGGNGAAAVGNGGKRGNGGPPRIGAPQAQALERVSQRLRSLGAPAALRPARPGAPAPASGPQQQQQEEEWVGEGEEEEGEAVEVGSAAYWLSVAEELGSSSGAGTTSSSKGIGGSSNAPGKRKAPNTQAQESKRAALDAAARRLQGGAAAPKAPGGRPARPGAPAAAPEAVAQPVAASTKQQQQKQQPKQQPKQQQERPQKQHQKQQQQQDRPPQQRKQQQQPKQKPAAQQPVLTSKLSGDQAAAVQRASKALGGSQLRRPPARPGGQPAAQ